MHGRTPNIIHLVLASLMIASLLVTGCGAARKAGESLAKTKVAEVAEEVSEAVESQEAEPAEEEGEEAAGAEAEEAEGEQAAPEDTLDNVVRLAPVHVVSSLTVKEGDEVTHQSSYEADIDAHGNQHMIIRDQDGQEFELYLVDGTLYIGTGEGQFVATGEAEEDAGFAFLAMYGGAYLLAYNDLSDATRLGREEVNGFATVKYEFKYDLASAGLGGVAAMAEGAQFDYEGYAWVEPDSGALVRSRVDWTGKAADEEVTHAWHSEFDVTRGTVTEITAPENVLSLQ